MKDLSFLQHYQNLEDKTLARQVKDKSEQVERSFSPRITDFMDPHQQEIVVQVVARYPGVKYSVFSGFPQAERARFLLLPHDWEGGEPAPLRFLAIEGDFSHQKVSHRDFLGSLLGTGLKRGKIGDIVVLGDRGAQVVVAAEVADYITSNLKSVHQVPVKVREIEQHLLSVRPPQEKEITGTVASLRLDAVTSLGFNVSRSRIAPVIKGERVKVNWQSITDPAAPVQAGDIISIPGRGRLQVVAVEGESRKGRIRLRIKKFI